MPKIYKIVFDFKKFRTLDVKKGTFDKNADLLLNGRKRAEEWIPLQVECNDPQKKEGHFYFLPPSSLVVNAIVKKILISDRFFTAEYLPVQYMNTGEELYAINFLDCINCLNRNASSINYDEKIKEIIGINRYVFHVHRLSESTVFKIPEMNGIETFTFVGCLDTELEFVNVLARHKLKGLLFQEVYEFTEDDFWKGYPSNPYKK